MNNMKVVMYMAITVNGLTARPDGTEEFLANENWDSMTELAVKYKNLIVGRKTYEINQSWPGKNNLRSLKAVKKIVVSGDSSLDLASDFTLVSSPQEALIKLQDYPTILLIGGGTLNASFAAKNLIDEIILNIDPTVIGKGRPVFAEEDFEIKLILISSRQITKNLIQLRYRTTRKP